MAPYLRNKLAQLFVFAVQVRLERTATASGIAAATAQCPRPQHASASLVRQLTPHVAARRFRWTTPPDGLAFSTIFSPVSRRARTQQVGHCTLCSPLVFYSTGQRSQHPNRTTIFSRADEKRRQRRGVPPQTSSAASSRLCTTTASALSSASAKRTARRARGKGGTSRQRAFVLHSSSLRRALADDPICVRYFCFRISRTLSV